jgi:quinol monooxygenase YgiN
VTSYYVYYRVEPAQVDTLRAQVERLFKAIEQATGVRGRWMRRRDDPATYMEVYENVADERGFVAVLAREAANLGLARRVERFICA